MIVEREEDWDVFQNFVPNFPSLLVVRREVSVFLVFIEFGTCVEKPSVSKDSRMSFSVNLSARSFFFIRTILSAHSSSLTFVSTTCAINSIYCVSKASPFFLHFVSRIAILVSISGTLISATSPSAKRL